MLELKEKSCVLLKHGTPPLTKTEIDELKKGLFTEWKVENHKKLSRRFPFLSFKRAMTFVEDVGLLAQQENHHPDICIHYTNVDIELSTHDIGGLSENDFIMAAKIEDL
ncbi:MAG: 4a-hydroxytetrahydrobiopterin dehydratase [Bacteroidales bacterium]|jgi:4a-hydroxytetrahydrobiopterin dehydratase